MITPMTAQKDLPLIDRTVWCNKYRVSRVLKSCVACEHRSDCKWREVGAMRRVKIDWGGIIKIKGRV